MLKTVLSILLFPFFQAASLTAAFIETGQSGSIVLWGFPQGSCEFVKLRTL